MMEKYGVDMKNLPPTDDQLRKIKKLSQDANHDFCMPKNRDEADDMIEKLANRSEGEFNGREGI
jgi:hypothetical protein